MAPDTDDDIVESIEILDRRGYVKATQMMNLKYWDFTVTTYGFEQYAMAYIKDYESIIRSVALEIVNNEDFVNGSIAEAVHQPIMLVNHIIQLFAEKGFFVSVAKSLSGTWKILGIASEMKRWIRSI